MANQFQLLDLNVNTPAKQFLKSKPESWYDQHISKQLDDGSALQVRLKLSAIKWINAK